MSVIRKFEVSTVVEVIDPATDDERLLDDEDPAPLVRLSAIAEARRTLIRWESGDREYISVHVSEVP